MHRKPLALAFALVASCLSAAAQSAYVPVSGTRITVPAGTPLTGKLVFTVTDTTDTPVTYTPQGGSASTAPITIQVTAGAVQNTGGFPPQVPNPATMTPANTRYRVQVESADGSTVYYTFPQVAITLGTWSYDGYRVPAGVTASGLGYPKVPCDPSAQYNNTQASDPYPWVCSKFKDGSLYWTQNPSNAPLCQGGNSQAIVSPSYGAPFCVDSTQAYVTPGFVFSGPLSGGAGQIGLVPASSLPQATVTKQAITSVGALTNDTSGTAANATNAAHAAAADTATTATTATSATTAASATNATHAVSADTATMATKAAALANNPTTCSTGQAAGGIVANGNAVGCFTPSGGGGGGAPAGVTTELQLNAAGSFGGAGIKRFSTTDGSNNVEYQSNFGSGSTPLVAGTGATAHSLEGTNYTERYSRLTNPAIATDGHVSRWICRPDLPGGATGCGEEVMSDDNQTENYVWYYERVGALPKRMVMAVSQTQGITDPIGSGPSGSSYLNYHSTAFDLSPDQQLNTIGSIPNLGLDYEDFYAPKGGFNDYAPNAPHGMFKSNYAVHLWNATFWAKGQHSMNPRTMNCYGVGDCIGGTQDIYTTGGGNENAFEGTHNGSHNLYETQYTFAGTCGDGCVNGSTSLSVNGGGVASTVLGDGLYLWNKTQSTQGTGLMVKSDGSDATTGFGITEFSSAANFPVSKLLEITTLMDGHSNGSGGNTVIPGTMTVNISSTAPAAGWQTSTANIPSSGSACLTDMYSVTQTEEVPYTVTGANTVQVTAAKLHVPPTIMAVGGLACKGIHPYADDADTSTAGGNTTAMSVVPIFASPDASHLWVHPLAYLGESARNHGFVNNVVPFGNYARSGNVATFSPFSGTPLWLIGQTFTVTDGTVAGVNGTYGPITANYDNFGYLVNLSAPSTGANISFQGGQVGTFQMQNGTYEIVPIAEIAQASNDQYGHPTGYGVQLAYNSMPLASGDQLYEAHNAVQRIGAADEDKITTFSPQADQPIYTHGVRYGFQGSITPGSARGWSSINEEPTNALLGYGGTHLAPYAGVSVEGPWQKSIEVDVAHGGTGISFKPYGSWDGRAKVFDFGTSVYRPTSVYLIARGGINQYSGFDWSDFDESTFSRIRLLGANNAHVASGGDYFTVATTAPTTSPDLGWVFSEDGIVSFCGGGGSGCQPIGGNGGGTGITQLTGDVTTPASSSGSTTAILASTAVTPGSYTNANITVDAKGRITAAANGSAGSGGGSGSGTVNSGSTGQIARYLANGTAVSGGSLTPADFNTAFAGPFPVNGADVYVTGTNADTYDPSCSSPGVGNVCYTLQAGAPGAFIGSTGFKAFLYNLAGIDAIFGTTSGAAKCYLNNGGTCDTPAGGGGTGSGTVGSGTTSQFAQYQANGTSVVGHTPTYSDLAPDTTSNGIEDMSVGSSTNTVPTGVAHHDIRYFDQTADEVKEVIGTGTPFIPVKQLAAGTGVTITNTGSTYTINASAGGGGGGSQTQNTFYAAPSGAPGTASFRSITTPDLAGAASTGLSDTANIPYVGQANTFNSTQTVPSLIINRSAVAGNAATVNFITAGANGWSVGMTTGSTSFKIHDNTANADRFSCAPSLPCSFNNQLTAQEFYSTVVTITASATPAIVANSGGLQTITLSANATPTVSGIMLGQDVTFQVCQPSSGGPYTWTWPSAMHGGATITTTASICTAQTFKSFNGTTLVAITPGVNAAP